MNTKYSQTIRALLTSQSDNLKYAPSGNTLLEKLSSLAKTINQEMELQLKSEPEDVKDLAWNFALAVMSRPSDCFAHNASLKEWVSYVVMNAKVLSKLAG